MYVCVSSVTLVHPAKAVGQNEMPFDRGTRVIPSDIVLDGGSGTPQEGDIWGRNDDDDDKYDNVLMF